MLLSHQYILSRGYVLVTICSPTVDEDKAVDAGDILEFVLVGT